MWRTEAGGGEGKRESPNKGGNKGRRGKEGLIQTKQFQEQKEALDSRRGENDKDDFWPCDQ